MAEGDAIVYNNAKEAFFLKIMDLDTDTFKVALVGAGYSLVIDGNIGYADFSANEIVASNYVAGGKALTALSVTQNDTDDRAEWDAGNLTWTSLGTATPVPVHAIVYDDTVTVPTADPAMVHWEIATNPNGGDYTLNFHANGLLLLT